MRRIAAEAGVSIGLINHHFPNKDTLVAESYRAFSRRLAANFEKAVAAAGQGPARAAAGILQRFLLGPEPRPAGADGLGRVLEPGAGVARDAHRARRGRPGLRRGARAARVRLREVRAAARPSTSVSSSPASPRCSTACGCSSASIPRASARRTPPRSATTGSTAWSGLEQPRNLPVVRDVDVVRRRGHRQARHRHDVAADHHDELRAGREPHLADVHRRARAARRAASGRSRTSTGSSPRRSGSGRSPTPAAA